MSPRRRSRRRDGSALLGLLLLAVILLFLLLTRGSLPTFVLPVTGLPAIPIPTFQVLVTAVPLTPEVVLPFQPGLAPALGARTKTSGCQVQGKLPDPACTPGAVFPEATAEQVCTPGYASSVRDVSQSLKEEVYRAYGITSREPGQYEIDHLVSLSLGGTNDIANLWPQAVNPPPGTNEKDRATNYLRDLVCSGRLSLQDAQRQIASNWLAVYNQMAK